MNEFVLCSEEMCHMIAGMIFILVIVCAAALIGWFLFVLAHAVFNEEESNNSQKSKDDEAHLDKNI